MSKIIVSMSGWCEANPEKVKFMYIGPEERDSITGTEWLTLTNNDRGDYILESIESAFQTAFDGEYNNIDIEVEE
jgi:hypothetical protein